MFIQKLLLPPSGLFTEKALIKKKDTKYAVKQ